MTRGDSISATPQSGFNLDVSMRSLVFGIAALVGGATWMTTVALAAPITYDVDLTLHNSPGTFSFNPLASATLSGTITTDGTLGPLRLYDLTSQNLTLTTNVGSSTVVFNQIIGSTSTDGLVASAKALSFLFGGGIAGAEVESRTSTGSITFDAAPDPGDGLATPSIFFIGPPAPNDLNLPAGTQLQPFGSSLTIGTAEGAGTVVSTVPLPASAPMFGAALTALGVVGFGVKRKKAAAAA